MRTQSDYIQQKNEKEDHTPKKQTEYSHNISTDLKN